MNNPLLTKSLSNTDLKALEKRLVKYNLPRLFELHGFLTAIISGPRFVLPSEWIDYLGLNNGDVENIEETEHLICTVMRLYNTIAIQLDTGNFHIPNPALLEKEDVDTFSLVKKRWAEGYLQGVALDHDVWLMDDEIAVLLSPIMSLRTDDEAVAAMIEEMCTDDLTPEKFCQHAEEALSKIANTIYQYWLRKRIPSADDIPQVRQQTKIGRNEPCPCGSRKKFKKCCLH